MCGLIGGSSPKQLNSYTIKTLFLYANNRGGDSCGYYGDGELYKEVGDSHSFVPYLFPETNQFIGHTRKKTTGAITRRNAHPFRFGKIVGAHNGYISNHSSLADGLVYEVDSEVAINLISKEGVAGISKLTGSMAFHWMEDDTIYLYRFNNPLFMGNLGDALYWGSEKDYLEGIKCENIFSLEPHTLYTVKNGVFTYQKLKTPEPKTYSLYTRYSGYTGYGWGSKKENEKADLYFYNDGKIPAKYAKFLSYENMIKFGVNFAYKGYGLIIPRNSPHKFMYYWWENSKMVVKEMDYYPTDYLGFDDYVFTNTTKRFDNYQQAKEHYGF